MARAGENWRAIEKPAEKLMRLSQKINFMFLAPKNQQKLNQKLVVSLRDGIKKSQKRSMMAQNF